jgi:hypothetical protein
MQRPMKARMCLGVKHTFHKWGRVQGMKPNDSQMHSHFGSCICAGITNVWNLGWKGKQAPNWAPMKPLETFLRHSCLRFTYIVHLDLIFMSYVQKKRWESNWEFDSWPHIPWKQGSNEIWLGRVIHS